MPMDPKKLKSYMTESHDGEDHDDEGAAHEAAESPEDERAEHDHEDEAFDETEEDEDEQAFEDFVGDVFTHAEDIEEAATTLDVELSHETQPGPDTVATMKEQLAGMPEAIVEGIATFIKGMPWDEVEELVSDLAEQGRIGDIEQVTGWLYWSAKNVDDAAGEDAGDDAEDDDE